MDDLVDDIHRFQQSFDDMRPLFGLFQVKARPPFDDLALILDVFLQNLLDIQDLGFVVHERQHDRAEAHLQLRMLIQLIEHHRRVRALFELDDDAHTRMVGFVVRLGDPVDLAVARYLTNGRD